MGARDKRIEYTDEQRAVIGCESAAVVVDARAGTGKTTTAVGFARARPNSRFLYMAFNSPIQKEAAQRFGEDSNTTCRTTHSLAFRAVGHLYGTRVTKEWRALSVRNEMGLPGTRQAALVQFVLTQFFQSRDDTIKLAHAQAAQDRFNATETELVEAVRGARSLWLRMQDRGDAVQMPHDAYLKMWALSRPVLPYDYIICDEWQDTNPVTAQVIEQQKRARLLVLGDPHQSIYAFRGAVNAMGDFRHGQRLHLTKTWRFGPNVAHVANLVLSELKGERHLIKAMGQDVPYRSGAPVTKLSRTNAQLFKDAIQAGGAGAHWVGGVASYGLDKIVDAYWLYAGKRDRIRDPFLRNFASFNELKAYGEEAKDRETAIQAEVIEEYTHEVPRLIEEVKANAVANSNDAALTLCTAHKAKGLDWDYVQLADDFEILADTEAELAADPAAAVNEQELNLLHVALTRARLALALNADTREWLANLEKHRASRRQGAARAQAHPIHVSPTAQP